MSLKILLFPFCIILSLILVIGYIKPNVTDILAKRDAIGVKQSDLARVDTTIQNVKRMTAEMNDRSEGEKFVLKYLPLTLEEERVLDTFNYFAIRSGVVIIEVNAEENEPVEAPIPEDLHASMSFQALASVQADAQVPPPIPQTRTLQSYAGSVVVMGTYSNIKDFFQRLGQSDRFRNTKEFLIEKPSEDDIKKDTGESVYPADFLRGSYSADFVYFPVRQMGSALDMALFQKERFDFSVVDDLVNYVSNPLLPLEADASARDNPFQ